MKISITISTLTVERTLPDVQAQAILDILFETNAPQTDEAGTPITYTARQKLIIALEALLRLGQRSAQQYLQRKRRDELTATLAGELAGMEIKSNGS